MMLGPTSLPNRRELRLMPAILVIAVILRELANDYSSAAKMEPEKWDSVGQHKLVITKCSPEELQAKADKYLKEALGG